MQSIFIKAQNSSWYAAFLRPVAEAIRQRPPCERILDIGTGAGKLPELLVKENDTHQKIIGIDINHDLLALARQRVHAPNVAFQHRNPNTPLGFAPHSFDAIAFCSVLFLLDSTSQQFLLDQARQTLRPSGAIYVLTPTGKHSLAQAFRQWQQFENAPYNWTFFIWKTMTAARGKAWQQKRPLLAYATQHGFAYQHELVFGGYASLETLTFNHSL